MTGPGHTVLDFDFFHLRLWDGSAEFDMQQTILQLALLPQCPPQAQNFSGTAVLQCLDEDIFCCRRHLLGDPESLVDYLQWIHQDSIVNPATAKVRSKSSSLTCSMLYGGSPQMKLSKHDLKRAQNDQNPKEGGLSKICIRVIPSSPI